MKDELRKQEKRLRGEFRDEIKDLIASYTFFMNSAKNEAEKSAYQTCIMALQSLLNMNYSRLSRTNH